MVHQISLASAIVILLVAVLFLYLFGPLALILIVVGVILLWWAFGPGSRSVVITS
jgi:hypothetical protein